MWGWRREDLPENCADQWQDTDDEESESGAALIEEWVEDGLHDHGYQAQGGYAYAGEESEALFG